MYGADKRRILEEVLRILKPGGVLDFTDILASRDLASDDRARLYDRVRTPEMWDAERYLAELIDMGFKIHRMEDWSEHVSVPTLPSLGSRDTHAPSGPAFAGR